jgi:hypothetical protein
MSKGKRKDKGRGQCPFLNDSRLFGFSANIDIWFKDDHFCSVADTIDSRYESINSEIRRVSATNKFSSSCQRRGETCPIFQKFAAMTEAALTAFYQKKWNNGLKQFQKKRTKAALLRAQKVTNNDGNPAQKAVKYRGETP